MDVWPVSKLSNSTKKCACYEVNCDKNKDTGSPFIYEKTNNNCYTNDYAIGKANQMFIVQRKKTISKANTESKL